MKLLLSSFLVLGQLAHAQISPKPAKVMDTDLNLGSSKCTRNMYECADDDKYNPRVSPNLKQHNNIWYEMEGLWYGTVNTIAANGSPQEPMVYNEDAANKDLPYPRNQVTMLMNLTVRETRVYKHVYYIYNKADQTFCDANNAVTDPVFNVIPPGLCGTNGYIEAGTKYAVASWDKNGVADIFWAAGALNGVDDTDNGEKGTISPQGANSLVTQIRGKTFSESETLTFNNNDKTRLAGTMQFQVTPSATIVDYSTDDNSARVLKETLTMDLFQTDTQDFLDRLSVAQDVANVPGAGRVNPMTEGNCLPFVVATGTCPTMEDFQAAMDPALSSSPYGDDSSIKAGYIVMFVILGLMIIAIIAFIAHYRYVKLQANSYKHQFARRVAQTIKFEGALNEVTPEALESEFKRIDEDGDGVLAKEELRHFMGSKMSEKDFDAMFAAIDIDHNGNVDFQEFCTFMAHVGSMPDVKGVDIVEHDKDELADEGSPKEGDEEAHHDGHLAPVFDDAAAEVKEHENKYERLLMVLAGFLLLCTIGLLIGVIVMAVDDKDDDNNGPTAAQLLAAQQPTFSNVPENNPYNITTMFKSQGVNTCEGKNPGWANQDCVHTSGPQAGANVTKGFKGDLDVSTMGKNGTQLTPFTDDYWTVNFCPVNVHWHLGTEHYSVGEYDEFGKGPNGNADAPTRRLAGGGEGDFQEFNVRGGFRCHHYDENDPKFTTQYDWKHCLGMQVGETYEIHWPHSRAGACGTIHQYQTPFYDGVFCNLDAATIATLDAQDVAHAVGVQGQVFTVVNDESYFYPDLIRGWMRDSSLGIGTDIAKYTGSTTGTSRSNEVCSSYSPITWQVDRKCHMISASSFDKLCYDMKQQLDDMADDLYAHGSRELVNATWTANNQQDRRKLARQQARKKYNDEISKLESSRGHSHEGHDHDHDHHHHSSWF